MRTDSTTLSETALNAARNQIQERFGDAYLPAQPRKYANKVKNAQEAHEAIRPAGDQFRTPDSLRGQLRSDEFRLYELIWQRTVASQMTDAVVNRFRFVSKPRRKMVDRPSSPHQVGRFSSRASFGRMWKRAMTRRTAMMPSAFCRT